MAISEIVSKFKSPKKENSGRWSLSLLVFVAICFFLSFSTLGLGEDLSKASGDRLLQIVTGGLLYDKWFAGFDKEDIPSTTHPAYPKTGKKKGNATWRCKECHGWDYKGKNGHYKKGSHFTGIAGLLNMAGVPENKIVPILKDKTHQFGFKISDENLEALASFVSAGQIEMTQYIDWQTYKAKGDADDGKRVYLTMCAKCHGVDGKKINFGSPEKPTFIGTVATGNPWESLHKIRMGQPAKEMPSMLAFPVQTQIDVLTYSQQLPKK